MTVMSRLLLFILVIPVIVLGEAKAADLPNTPPPVRYHLTARPWRPLEIDKNTYLDRIEGVVRFSARHQDADGAIIDPFIKKEHQYATPYYAHALGTLISTGRAKDLTASGVRAMEWATRCFEKSRTDGHRVFFTWPLVQALDLYKPYIKPEMLEAWRKRLSVPVAASEAGPNNWTTYLMKGEWLRAQVGLIDKADAIKTIEHAWADTQRERIFKTDFNLYHDLSSDPDTLAVEVVGRANLLALVEAGYDGPSAAEIRQSAETGTVMSLRLQDPSGQMPCNGRTDDHVWGDVGYQLAFEVLAEREHSRGNAALAGQYRHAALLTFQNIERWRRADGDWAGSYFITKNHFDPALRVGYQRASQYSNYSGSLMHHLAEAWHVRHSDIPEAPVPAEIGGYAFDLDKKFSSAVANAGGMQMQLNLRGDTNLLYDRYWVPLGVVRLGRVGWETRLGPADGGRNEKSKLGVSFAPTFEENGQWIRLASVPERYEGKFSVQFTHPLLVRCAVDYAPRKGKQGPVFRHEFTLTPDGVLATLKKTSGEGRWGVTLPLLENDGAAALEAAVDETQGIARTRYAKDGDEQNFIVLGGSAPLASEPAIRSAYGDLRPVRAEAAGREAGDETLSVFVYPRSPGDPSAEAVKESMKLMPDGFKSVLGSVKGDLYAGRTAAGGVGKAIDLNGDGQPEATFDEACGFVLQKDEQGKIKAVEADRDGSTQIQGGRHALKAYTPARF